MLAPQTRSLATEPTLSSSSVKYVVWLCTTVNRHSSHDSKVRREHFASRFPSASDKVQRIMVQCTGKNNRDYGHGHHESDRCRFSASDCTANKWTEASCENPPPSMPARDLPGNANPIRVDFGSWYC